MSRKQTDEPPAVHDHSFLCPHCDTWSEHQWWSWSRTPWAGYIVPGQPQPQPQPAQEYTLLSDPSGAINWSQSSCNHCGGWTLWRGEVMVYPLVGPAPAAHKDMPPGVADLYEEARKVAAVSRRAGAGMARATMERLLRTLLENERDDLILLIDQVEPLVDRSTADLLTFVRHVGNVALHGKDKPDGALVLVLDERSTAAMTALFVTVNRLVDELIARPAQTAALMGTVPETVKETVEQLRAKRQGGSS